ncbi:hypothetical protein [Cellulomonas fengjieae]|uniref:Uncharacterized protein n=1 Tax=Cellulomonas fengjieae TaxID=2819978 RepID=A0ABS3SLM0_9CELL|nr:hypothetical protein [Cellulomonas fengjieae]MBO3086628.1 hypothetical protein [Cellulomonas fengjieae]QVI66523.1 hypothetical protein KG102_02635 [Cellulomonas fengjieae]
MNGADWFDFGMGALPRKVAKLVIAALVLIPGGGFAAWYVNEKAAGIEEMVQDYLDHLVATLSMPSVAPVSPAATP